MPKKFNLEWKYDGYEGFSSDMKSLLDMCQDIAKNDPFEGIKNELQTVLGAMPEGDAKKALSDVIASVAKMQSFVNGFNQVHGKKSSDLNRLAKGSYQDGDESLYRSDIGALKIYLKSVKTGFFESKYDELEKKEISPKGAKPLDLRAVLDDFNLKDDYNSYDKNEDLFKRVDDLFNKYTQIQDMMLRIYTLQDSFETENRLKEHISNKETALRDVGEIAYKHPDIVFSAVKDDVATYEKQMKEGLRLRNASNQRYQEKTQALEEAKIEKRGLEKRKDEFDEKKSAAESKLSENAKKLEKAERDEKLMKEVMSMRLSDLSDFEKAHMQEVLSSKDIISTSYGENISQQRSYQHEYSKKAQKYNKEIQDLLAKSKSLKPFSDMLIPIRQSTMFVDLIMEISEKIEKLPASLGIDARGKSILKLQGILKNKIEKDDRIGVLYEAVSVAADLCPNEFKIREMDLEFIQDLQKTASEKQLKLKSDKAYEIALNISALMEEGQKITDRLSRMDKKDPERKSLEAKQKAIIKEVNAYKKDKAYIKDSEKLVDLINKSEENTKKANECRFNILDTYALADMNEGQLEKKKKDDITRAKYTVIADMEVILQKVPEEPKEVVEKLKEALETIKKSDDISDVRKARKIFSDNLKVLEQSVKGNSYDLNKEAETLEKEVAKWDYAAAIKACDDKIKKCEDDVEEAEKDFDKHREIFREYDNKYENMADIRRKLDDMYRKEADIVEFENDKSNGKEAKDELGGYYFFSSLQKTFSSFDRRKDHNKGDHQNTEEYRLMDTRLGELLALDPKTVTATAYRQALNDLKAAANAYIDKKNAQRFHWLPSKLRKYRLQYAKGLADMCTSQLDTIDEADFTKTDPSVSKYLDDVASNQSQKELRSKEQYLSDLMDIKQDAIKVYKKSAGIEDQPGVMQTDIQQNSVINVEPQEAEGPQIAQGIKNKEFLKP